MSIQRDFYNGPSHRFNHLEGSRRIVGVILRDRQIALLLHDSGEWVNTWGLGLDARSYAEWRELVPGHVYLDPICDQSEMLGLMLSKAEELKLSVGH